jgi:hypothetical protein
MSFNPISYFAGIGTVSAAIAIGFGGGIMLTTSAYKPEPQNRVERVASNKPLPAPSAPQATAPAVQAASAVAATPAAATPEPTTPSAPPQRAMPQQPPSTETTRAATAQPAAVTEQPSLVRESTAKPPDEDVDARRIARKKAEHRKWAERKHRQDLDAATMDVRKMDRDDAPEVVQRDIIETPRLGFFGEQR